MDKVGLGRPCQLSRDDQCLQNAAPGGARCLHNICVAVNATLGNTCTFENTIYTDFIDGNNNYGDIVSRDNCMAGLYCDSPSTTCREKLIKGGACSADKECRTGYCLDKSYLASVPVNNNVTGTCGEDEANAPPKAHVYALITIFSVLIAVGTLASLIYIHVRQTKAKKLAREEYWQEQRVISEKARQIDGSMRIKSSSFSSRHRLLPADSDISQSSSTSPSRRESRLHLVQRASDRSGSAPSSRFEGAISTTHPLQADYPSYLSVRQQEGGSSDNEYTNLPYTPTQEANEHAQASSSTHNLHDVYLGLSSAAMGAKIGSSSSAYDPFASSNEADRGIRSRETARHPTGDGWSSPDVRLNDETDWANEERRLLNVPKTGNPV